MSKTLIKLCREFLKYKIKCTFRTEEKPYYFQIILMLVEPEILLKDDQEIRIIIF